MIDKFLANTFHFCSHFCKILYKNILKKLSCYHDNYFRYFMFGKYNGFVSKARVSACMYFLVFALAESTNSPRLFTPGETKALAKSKVHQISRAWVTNRGSPTVGGHPQPWVVISKIWRTVMNSEHCDWSNLKFAL